MGIGDSYIVGGGNFQLSLTLLDKLSPQSLIFIWSQTVMMRTLSLSLSLPGIHVSLACSIFGGGVPYPE